MPTRNTPGLLVFNRVIIPVDGSERAWRAARVGSALAHQCAAELELLQIVETDADTESAQTAVSRRAAAVDLHDLDPIVTVLPVETSVAATIAVYAASASARSSSSAPRDEAASRRSSAALRRSC